MLKRFINIGVRGLTGFLKVSVVFILGLNNSPESVGLFALVSSTVAYGILIFGFDLYIYTNRLIVKNRLNIAQHYIDLQFFLISFIYLLALSILFLFKENIKIYGSISIFYIFILISLEHLSQEIYRILVITNQQIEASLVYFIRSGIWPLVLLLIEFYDLGVVDIALCMDLWLVSVIFSIIYGLRKTGSIGLKLPKWNLNRNSIKAILFSSLTVFLSTLLLRGLFHFDKVILESFAGLKYLGLYAIYFSIGNAFIVLLESGVFSFHLGSLLKSFESKDRTNTLIEINEMVKGFLYCSVVYIPLCVVVYFYFIPNVLSDDYIADPVMFALVIISSIIFSASLIPHYVLYGLQVEKHFLKIHMIVFAFFLIGTYVIQRFTLLNNLAVPASMLFAMIVMLAIKLGAAHYFYSKMAET